MPLRTAARRPARRGGFTLIELLVSAAVCVIIMTILSTCFQAGLDTLRQLRAQGDMTDQLRATYAVLKRDFLADHFLPVEAQGPQGNPRNAGRRLSDYRFDPGPPAQTVRTGFVRVNSPASTFEGADGSGFDSFRATNHAVWFTCVLSGQSDADVYVTASNGTQFTSEAAEVAYFLGSPNGVGLATGSASGGTVPLFNLYRRQRLVAVSGARQGTYPTNDPDVISTTNPGTPGAAVNTMFDVANGRRPSLAPPTPPAPPTTIFAPLGGGRFGDDILLSNVISFEVKPLWAATRANVPLPRPFNVTGSTAAVGSPDVPSPPNPSPNPFSTDHPYDSLSALGDVFDTVPGTAVPANGIVAQPLPVRVIAFQVRVRVYDTKLKTARQATYIFDQ